MIGKILNKIRPGCSWGIDGNDIEWKQDNNGTFYSDNFYWDQSNVQAKPLRDEIEAAKVIVQIEVNSTQYQRLRSTEYPPLTDLADAMYWASQGDNTKLDTYYTACEAVKLKYPKANNE